MPDARKEGGVLLRLAESPRRCRAREIDLAVRFTLPDGPTSGIMRSAKVSASPRSCVTKHARLARALPPIEPHRNACRVAWGCRARENGSSIKQDLARAIRVRTATPLAHAARSDGIEARSPSRAGPGGIRLPTRGSALGGRHAGEFEGVAMLSRPCAVWENSVSFWKSRRHGGSAADHGLVVTRLGASIGRDQGSPPCSGSCFLDRSPRAEQRHELAGRRCGTRNRRRDDLAFLPRGKLLRRTGKSIAAARQRPKAGLLG